jgi:DNA-binding NarL/FixJ family response regulator
MSTLSSGWHQAEWLDAGSPGTPRNSAALTDTTSSLEHLRVFVATGVAIYEHGLVHVLGSCTAIEVAGSARTMADTIAAAEVLHPDLVLLDVSLPRALDCVRALRALARRIPVLGLAVDDDERYVLACVEAGITACVPREASLTDLLAAMWGAMRGEAICSPRIAGAIFRRIADLAEHGAPTTDSSALTTRERDFETLVDPA